MLILGLISLALLSLTVAIHAVGTLYWIRFLRNSFLNLKSELSHWRILALLISTAIFLLILHLLEIMLWAIIYLMLHAGEELKTLEQSIYFSSITFTTLGYGDITISSKWQLLSGIEAMNGILLFGWSSALLFTLLEQIWQRIKRDT